MKNPRVCLPNPSLWSFTGPGTAGCLAGLLTSGITLPGLVWGAEHTVRQGGGGDFAAVQAAIDAANPGDTITILDSATYVEDISFGVMHPSFLESKANITLQAADGERPTIQAQNTVDRFDFGGPDYTGMLILSSGVTVRGLDILNDGNASTAPLGLGSALSIHAGNVTIEDCDISLEGGVIGAETSIAVLVSDVARLAVGGAPVPVDNVLFEDCEIHHSPAIGMAVFPVAYRIPGGSSILDSSFHVTLDGCTLRDNALQGFETDGFGSVTMNNVTVQDNGGDGLQLSIELAALNDCEVADNGAKGVTVEYRDVGEGDAITVTGNGLSIYGNGSGGLEVAEGTVTITNLVCAENDDYNLRLVPVKGSAGLPAGLPAVTCSVDHLTLYYPPLQNALIPNVLVNTELHVDRTSSLVLRNAILVGPVGIDNFYEDIPAENLVVDYGLLWNGGSPVSNPEDYFTETNPVDPVDPDLVDPPNRDFRLSTGSPVAEADDQGGPLGGAGIVVVLPETVAIEAVSLDEGRPVLNWQGHSGLIFDVYGGGMMDSVSWPVLDSVSGAEGPQQWSDSRTLFPGQYYRIEGREP